MDDARRLDILKQNYLLRPLMAYLSSYKRNYKNTPNAYCRKGQGIKLKTLVLKYSLARLYDEADGGAFFPTDIDSGKLGDADDVNPIFLKVTTGDGDCLTAWLTAPAPIACTSARWCSWTTSAIAPATAEVREFDETLRMSIGLSPTEAEMSPPDN